MSLATAEELRTFLAVPEEEFDADRASLLLEMVSDEIHQVAKGHPFKPGTTTAVLDGSGTSLLFLPYVPVTDVVQITDDDGSLIEGYRWSADGQIRLDWGIFIQRFRYYSVTYSHGPARVPLMIAGLALRVAARGYVNPTGQTNEGAGGYTAGYGFDNTRLVQLTQFERNQVLAFTV